MSQLPANIRLALTAPAGPLTVINETLLQEALAASRQSPRRRVILPFHKGNDDGLHRMFNAVQPGTYIRPHRHVSAPKAESIVVLRGAIHFFEFTETGEVRTHFRLAAGSAQFGVDLESGVIHTFIAMEDDTVLFEVKPGPYAAITDKDFAAWAPAEGAPEAAAYLEELCRLAISTR
jgi:cupin fold WbuC family metalloprotein